MKLLRNFGSVVTGDITSSILGGFFWLFLATLLTVENYGEIQYLISIASMAVGFSLIANSNNIIVYEIKKRNLTSTLFLISLILAGISVVILFFIYSRLDIIFLTFGLMIGEMMIGYIIGKKLFIKYVFYIILQKGLMVILGIGFHHYFGIDGIIYGIALSYIPLSIIIYQGLKESKIDFLLLRDNYKFILNNYLIKIISFARKHLDKIIIFPILGFGILGEFALAIQIYMIMILFSNISFKFLLLKDASGSKSKKIQSLVLLTSVVITILGITLSSTLIPIFFPNFIEIIDIIPILSLSVIPYTLGVIFTSKFLGGENSKFPLIGTIIHVISYLILIIILGLTYGLIGLSVSFVISSIISNGFLIITYKIQKNKGT